MGRLIRIRVGAVLVMGCVAAAAVAAPEHRLDTLERVKNAISLKDFTGALGELQRLASQGNPDAQYLLGVFYLNALAGPRDPAQARLWL